MTKPTLWSLPLVILLFALALFFWLAPARHNPIGHLDLTQRPGLGTRAQLLRAKSDPKMCFRALDAAGILYTALPDESRGSDCGLKNALTLDRSLTPYSVSLQMTCTETATLYLWERHVARPAALEMFGSPIERIESYGSFSCRNVAGTKRRSEHAQGNAIDISGIRLKDGRLIDVKTHWDSEGDEGEFLKRLHKGACGLFSVTLGPNFDAAHADHFHMDMGPHRTCR